MMASPGDTAVASPVGETVATAVSLERQVKDAFLGLPFCSNWAENCCGWPGNSVAALGLTTTTLPPATAADMGLLGSPDVQPTNTVEMTAKAQRKLSLIARSAERFDTISEPSPRLASRRAPNVIVCARARTPRFLLICFPPHFSLQGTYFLTHRRYHLPHESKAEQHHDRDHEHHDQVEEGAET